MREERSNLSAFYKTANFVILPCNENSLKQLLMKKITFLIVILISSAIFSQQKSDFWKHVRFGGGFGLSFGSSTNILIAPSAIYNFNNGFSLGTGLNYQHSEYGNIKTNLYGISLISLYDVPLTGIQLSGEFEQLFASQTNGNQSSNFNYPALHLGASYRNGRVSFGVRYDLLYNKNKSIYASPISPIIRFYF